MPYYRCPRVGTGTIDNPFRAQLPKGINHAAIELKDGTFLVHTEAELDAQPEIITLNDADALALVTQHNREADANGLV